jgi:hypothetical protein
MYVTVTDRLRRSSVHFSGPRAPLLLLAVRLRRPAERWARDGSALERREHPQVYHRPLFQVVETLKRARTRETLWPQEMTISGGPMPKRRERALTIRVSGFLGRGDREKWSALRFA